MNNLGCADKSFVSLRVIQSLNSVEIKNSIINMLIPAYSDTLSFWVLTKNLPGEYFLSVKSTRHNLMNEIYERWIHCCFSIQCCKRISRD